MAHRKAGFRILGEVCHNDALFAREVEAWCHAGCQSVGDYNDMVRRVAVNVRLRDKGLAAEQYVHLADPDVAVGTLIGHVEEERLARNERFEDILQSKLDTLTKDKNYEVIVKCKRCGSSDVHWDEKQTRSADEGATVFCTCLRCKQKWVIR